MALNDLLAAIAQSVAGALGFLTRVPVGRDDAAWSAFADNPAAAVVPGYVVGCLSALVVAGGLLVGSVPAAVVAFAYLVAVYGLVGVNNLDGVADCGDAAVVHGNPGRRREVLSDTTTGVGAIAAVALVVVGLALGALAVATAAVLAAVAVVVAAEVGARLGLAGLAATADAPHEGLGSAIANGTDSWTVVAACWLSAPAVLWPLALPGSGRTAIFVAAAGALAGALGATALVARWARSRLGGANGDVFGAATELARVAGLHVGVLAWTLS